MLRNCYKSVKLEATNYLTEDVNYGIIKVHQGEEDPDKLGKLQAGFK